MTSNDVSTCSGLRGSAKGYLLLVTKSRSCDLLAQVSKCLVRYLRRVISIKSWEAYDITGRPLGGVLYTLSQILNHYDQSNPLSPNAKLKSPRADHETLEALSTAPSVMDIFTYYEIRKPQPGTSRQM